MSGNPKIHLDLAVVHMHLGNWPALESAARELQRFAPSDASGYAFQAVAESNSQRDDEAAIHFFAALVLNRDDAQVRSNLATRYERLGVHPSPVGATSSALIDPTDPRVRGHVNAAFALLVRNHETAGLHRQAAQLRELAVSQFRVPAELVTGKGSG
jgi:Flp pilus assembly protein TadD